VKIPREVDRILPDETAQVGSLVFLFAAIMFFGLLLMILNPIVFEDTEMMNDQLDIEGLTPSQERYDAFATVLQFWYALPITFLLAFGYYHWKVSLQERENRV
jgi:hypothetical protein